MMTGNTYADWTVCIALTMWRRSPRWAFKGGGARDF